MGTGEKAPAVRGLVAGVVSGIYSMYMFPISFWSV